MGQPLHYTRSSDGTRIAFEVAGEGAPVVLLHGWTETRESWVQAGYRDRLLDAGFRVILVDQRGHGASERPHDPASYAGSLRLADLAAVLDALGERRASLLGYSMGGVVALAAAAMMPERVYSVVAIGAHSFAEDLAPLREHAAAGIDRWLAFIEETSSELDAATRSRILANDPAAVAACVARDRPDFSAALAASGRPILALIGGDDARHHAMEALSRLGNVEAVSIPAANHFQSFRAAQRAMPEILRFLARHATDARMETA